MNDHFKEYTEIQDAKHILLTEYLKAWFPIIAQQSQKVGKIPKILYIETHAGAGRFESGEVGSPIHAINTIKNHSHIGKLPDQSKINFYFLEAEENNFKSLLAQIPPDLPKCMSVNPIHARYEDFLDKILAYLLSDCIEFEPKS